MSHFFTKTLALMTALGALQSTVLAQNATRNNQLRSWITERMQGHQLTDDRDEGIALEWTLTTTTTKSRSEVDSKWNQVKNYPDHPERAGMIYHRSLLKTPDIMTGELAFCDSRAWLEITEGNTRLRHERGGVDGVRWMMYHGKGRGQLTVIKAGVDFPSFYNVSSYYDQARDRFDLFFNFGFGSFAGDASVRELKAGVAKWTAEIYELKRDRITYLEGHWDADSDTPLVDRSRTPSRSQDGWTETQFQGFTYSDALKSVIPQLIVTTTAGDLKQEYRITPESIHRLSRTSLNKKAAIPAVPEGTNIVDFQKDTSAVWDMYARASRATWTQTEVNGTIRDSYHVEPPAGGPLVVARQAEPATTQNGISWTRIIAIGLVIVCVVGIPIFVYKRLR